MKTTKIHRHGEIGFVEIPKLPKDLTKSDSKTIMQGSHGNSHTYNNGEFYPKVINQYVFGYFVAKNTTLFHPDHGKEVEDSKLKEAKLPDGVYELRKQNEFINNELRPVVD